MVEETKHDLWLKRVQILVAIVAGLITVAIGFYNLNKTYFTKEKPEVLPPPPVQVASEPQSGSKIKSALEDVGASWLESLKKDKVGK